MQTQLRTSALPAPSEHPVLNRFRAYLRTLAPGFAFCIGIAGASYILAMVEKRIFGYPLLEPLVLALVIGLVVRAVWSLMRPFPVRSEAGINVAAKELLEFAIVLLGASLNLGTLISMGPRLLGAVLLSVTVAIGIGTVLGRLSGLSSRLAILVAVGNAVCGNSAIAAVAPAIRAKKQEVASAIALAAVLGVVAVLGLPALIPIAGLSHAQYGILAGLTVYAVPQVLAATFPVSTESGQIGTLVKLARVMLLGPVVAIFALLHRGEQATGQRRFSLGRFVPWFVIGFLLLAVFRTADLIPAGAGAQAETLSKLLTIVAMAGLGLGVELRDVRKAGLRVGLVIVGMLVLLIALALTLIKTLHLGA